jgi:small subunit ribosomal protein S6
MAGRYEIVYIFASALEEPQINERLERYHALLGGPDTVEVNHWGKRTLAYPIKKQPVGYYVLARFDATTEQLTELQRVLRLDESVLRFLIVLADDQAGLVTSSPRERDTAASEEAES